MVVYEEINGPKREFADFELKDAEKVGPLIANPYRAQGVRSRTFYQTYHLGTETILISQIIVESVADQVSVKQTKGWKNRVFYFSGQEPDIQGLVERLKEVGTELKPTRD